MLRNIELDSNYLVSFDSFETKVLMIGGSAFFSTCNSNKPMFFVFHLLFII